MVWPNPFPFSKERTMPSDGGVIAICEAYSTIDTPTTPVLVGDDNVRFQSPCVARIQRAGSTGGGVLYGISLPSTNGVPTDQPTRTSQGRKIRGSDDQLPAANTGRSNFLTDIPFVALSAYNWVVIVTDSSAGTRTCYKGAGSASTGAGEFYVETDAVGSKITIGASVALGGFITDNDTVEVYYVGAPTALLTVTGQFQSAEIAGASVMYYDPDSNTGGSATNIYISPVGQ